MTQCKRNKVSEGGQRDEDGQNSCASVVPEYGREELGGEELTRFLRFFNGNCRKISD